MNILGIEGSLTLAPMSREGLERLYAALAEREREIQDREPIPLDLLQIANRRTAKVRAFLHEQFPVRMWMVDPKRLCEKHLLGEHCELHMLVGSIARGRDLANDRLIPKGWIDTRRIQDRHDALAGEMERRKIRHDSPLHYVDELGLGDVDERKAKQDLFHHCRDCARPTILKWRRVPK